MLKDFDFCHLGEIYLTHTDDNYSALLQKTGINTLKTVTEKVAHKAVEATGEFIGK